MDFIVIGGDAAGMSAASKAKRLRADINVVVFEKTRDVSYSACGMPYNIADKHRKIDDLVVRQAQVFREKQNIDLRLGHQVQSIDPNHQKVSGTSDNGDTFEISYDKLLIATGGSAIVPDLPGIDLPGVKVLKSLDDGRKIKTYLATKNVKHVVIIGMGYIGLEMCEALRARSIEVSMIKPNPILLPWMPPELSRVVQEELASHGVKLYPGHSINKIVPKSGRLCVICSDLELESDMALIAIGLKPNSEIASQAGLETSIHDAIAVDNTQLTSNRNIYAAGDCADAYHVVTGQKTWIPLALRANRAGWAAADNVCDIKNELAPVAGTAVFKVFNQEVARTGLSANQASQAGYEPLSVVIQSRSRAHAHPGSSTIWVHMIADKRSGQLLGVQMVGSEGVAHRINAPAVALHNHMSVADFSQTDLAYAPPFGPVWDPMLTAANQLRKKL